MREIKFRVWDKNKNKINYDITGFECSQNIIDGVFIDGEYFNLKNGILMQYTGLKDKNGVEIYEGDIIETCENYGIGEVWLKYEVKYNEQLAQFVLFPIVENGKYNSNNWDVLINYYHEQAREVVGNIYEDSKESGE